MNSKRPYKHILKNLLHEQATQIIPLLLPGYRVEQVLDVELPELKSTEIESPPSKLEQGLVGLVLPEATVLKAYKTEWIEHSGNFERAYRVQKVPDRTRRRRSPSTPLAQLCNGKPVRGRRFRARGR